MTEQTESLLLKWGTLKGYNVSTDASKAALQKYFDYGVCVSAAMQRDSDAQKSALCELIDAIQGEIQNDWTGEMMTKDQAKTYVLEYRQ